MTCLRLIACCAVLCLAAFPLRAEQFIWSAEDAFAAAEAGEIILLDIRRPSEWAETGVGQGAWPVSMHTEDFGPNMRAIITANVGTPIAVICATGVRSAYLADILAKNGIEPVIDVSEGMLGSRIGAGWVADGLPISTPDAARAAMPANFVLAKPE